jgi:hypothetical protein
MRVHITREKHLFSSSFLSVRLSLRPTGRIFMKLYFYENLSRNSGFGQNRTAISGTLYEYLNTFLLLTAVLNIF